jgi:cell division protein FtsZ
MTLEDQIRITVIATGFERNEKSKDTAKKKDTREPEVKLENVIESDDLDIPTFLRRGRR